MTAALDDLLAGRTSITVIAPHPDDETLGCGRLLADAWAAGIACKVVCVTDGARSHPNSRRYPPEKLAALRQAELEMAVQKLGSGIGVDYLGYPDCAAPQDGHAVDRICTLMPPAALLLSPWRGDPHVDHQSCATLAAHVTKRTGCRHLAYPIWGRVRPVAPPPTDILRYHGSAEATARKRAALACHCSQMTALIDDDPEGFVMDADLQAMFLTEPELFHAP